MVTNFVMMHRLFGAHFVAVIILKIQNMMTTFVVAMGYIYNYTYISLMQIVIVVNTGLLNHQLVKYDLLSVHYILRGTHAHLGAT